jgi:hypothetical protein
MIAITSAVLKKEEDGVLEVRSVRDMAGGREGEGRRERRYDLLLVLDQTTSRSADIIATAWVTNVLDNTIDAAIPPTLDLAPEFQLAMCSAYPLLENVCESII